MISKKSVSGSDIKSQPIAYKEITQYRIGTPQGVPYFRKKTLGLDKKGKYVNDLYGELIKTMPSLPNEFPKTVILNIGVGRGKTTAIYEFIEYLYKETDHVIIMASPFKALVEKDYTELTNGDPALRRKSIPMSDVVHYQEVRDVEEEFRNGKITIRSKEKSIKKLAQKRIHIISVNSLMGNPGDKHFYSSGAIKYYLQCIRDYIADDRKGRSAYMFFDELHESVHNFSNIYLFNLFKWDHLLTNLYISSATFTESSLEVVTYLTWLSRSFVTLLELPRSKYPKDKQSRLHLVFVNGYFQSNNYEGISAIEDIIQNESYELFHILSYSKSLIESMAKESFYKAYNPNICIAGQNNSFQPGRVNMGTNFKTGVNIPKGEPLFVILPPNYTSIDRNPHYGIFTDGEPAIIQALARARADSDVYVFIPLIDSLIDDNGHTKSFLSKHSIDNQILSGNIELPLPRHEELYKLITAYERLYGEVRKEIDEYVEEVNKAAWFPEANPIYPNQTDKRPPINVIRKYFDHFGTYIRPVVHPMSASEFILKEGQEFLIFSYLSIGKKIYPYVLWAALNDQFTNCTLKSIYKYYRPTAKLTINSKGNYVKDIIDFLDKETDLDINLLKKEKAFDAYLKIKELLEKKNIEKGGRKKELKISMDQTDLDFKTLISNATFWKCILGASIEHCSTSIKISLKDVEDYYMNQRILQSQSNKSNELMNAYSAIMRSTNDFINKNGSSNPIMRSKYSNNKSGYPKRKDLTRLLNAMKVVAKEDELFKMPAFSRFSNKNNESQAYRFFTKHILELGNKLGKKGVKGMCPVKHVKYNQETINRNMF